MSEWSVRGSALVDALARADASLASPDRHTEIVETLRGLIAEGELTALLLEARLEELARVREQLAAISYPVIEVREDILCMPIVGPIDADIVQAVSASMLHAAATRRARVVVVDLTGAHLADVDAAQLLFGMFRALRLLGIRAALCGVGPQLARTLVELPELPEVSVHSTLAAAIAAVPSTQKAGHR
jgi:anti-anti-sigma regulatory factor